MAIGGRYEACRGGVETRGKVGWANDIAGDPGGTTAQALSIRSVSVVGGPLGGGNGYWGRVQGV